MLFKGFCILVKNCVIALCISIVGAILYNAFHPHSKPGIATIVMILLSGALVVVLMRFPLKFKITHGTIIFLATVALAVRLCSIVLIPNEQVSDFKTFNELAGSLKHGYGFSYIDSSGLSEAALFLNKWDRQGPVHTAFRLPGFPVILALMYSITGEQVIFGKVLNAILCVMIGLALYMLVKTVDRQAALIAMVFWLYYPGTIIASNLLCTEISFILFLMLTGVLIQYIPGSAGINRFYSAFFAGLCCSLSALIRPAMQFILCSFCVMPFLRVPLKIRFVVSIVFAVGLAGPLVLWGMRNEKMFGVFEMQTTEIGFNLFSMTRQVLKNEHGPQLDSLKKIMATSTDEYVVARTGKAIGMVRYRLALQKWWTLPKVVVLNHLRCWRDDCDMINSCKDGIAKGSHKIAFNWCSIMAYLITIAYLSLALLAIIGAIRLPWQEFISQPGLALVLLYFLGSCVLILFFEVNARHHFPLLIILCALASFFKYGKSNTQVYEQKKFENNQ